MSGNDDLKSVAPHSLGKFNADLVRLLWRNLTVLEALEAVRTAQAVFLRQHLAGKPCLHILVKCPVSYTHLDVYKRQLMAWAPIPR